MVTFNIDSLDFEDDEEAQFGSNTDFATRFDSANSRLELADVTNGTTGYVPQDVGTDLVGGKYAQTVSEGKALADDGNVYDSIQTAVNNASSYVKIGPGTFIEDVRLINKNGLTIAGSGERTVLRPADNNSDVQAPIEVLSSGKCTIRNLSIFVPSGADNSVNGIIGRSGSVELTIENVHIRGSPPRSGIQIQELKGVISNCTVEDAQKFGIFVNDTRCLVVNNTISGGGDYGILMENNDSSDSVVAHNIIDSPAGRGIELAANDTIVIANRISNTGSHGIFTGGNPAAIDNIIANNRISNSGNKSAITDAGTGTVLDGNLIT